MASPSTLTTFLSLQEFQTLQAPVREKINDVLNKKDSDLNKLKIQLAKFQTESEQKIFDLDCQLKTTRDQKEQEEVEKGELQNQKNALEADLRAIQEQFRASQSKIISLEEVCSALKRDKEALAVNKDDVSSLLSRRNDDVDRLTSELKVLTDQLLYANKEKSEAMIKSEELSSKQLALDYKEKRLDQERDLVVRQLKVLQNELDNKTNEILTMRREKTSKVLELQADLTEKIEELKIAQRSLTEMTSTIEQQEKQIKELNTKLKELSETEHKMAENARNELRSQVRLCELYKSSSEDAQAKAEELSKATEELQRLLRDASVRYGELETETKDQIDNLNQQLKASNEANEELRKELERANAILDTSKSRLLSEESIEAMSPLAAAASRLLKSGMTLTQIYSQYVTVSEQLLLKEEENKKLNNYIDQILQEIEDRAPIIARQREDYEKSVEMVANLTRQLDLAVEEAEKEKEDALEARRLLGQSQRNSQRFEKQVIDLGKQVSFLLREVEELRGNKMRDAPSDEEHQVSSTEDGSAGAIISRHLVTFRDVEELQHRNQMLLNTLREVTEKQEEAERNAIDEKTAKIEQALEKALGEVEQMREARRRQEELVQGIIQQRDMYRIMAQEGGLNESRSPVKFRDALTSTPAASRSDSFRSSDAEKQLSECKVRLEEQEAKYKTLLQEKKELERNLNEKIQGLQDSLVDLRAHNARLGTQIEYANEKEKLLMGNLDGFKKQINILEEKSKTYACTVAKHEQSIAVLRDEAMNAQQKLARAEVTVSMLEQEKQLLKTAEQRLVIERDSLLTERRSQSLLHVNLESIKLNLERGESETRMRLQNTVTALEKQIELLRKKLEVEEQRYRETVKSFEDRIEADKALLSKAEERASQAEARLTQAQELIASNESTSMSTSPSRKGQVARLLSIPAGAASADDEAIKDLKTQLSEARTEASCARDQLQAAREQAQQYRSIADSMEEQLKKNNEAAALFKEETEQRLNRFNEERETLAKNLEEAQEKIKKLEEGAEAQGQMSVHQREEIAIKLRSLEAEVTRLNEQLKAAEESERKAREDFMEQARQAKEAQDRYERELVQHAADIEQLNNFRELAGKNHKELSELQQSRSKLEEELQTGRTSWQSQKQMLEKEIADKNVRCSELDKQVDLMQQQIVNLSTRMAAVTRVHETPVKSDGEETNTSLNMSIGEEETRTGDQLLELVRFLRREKEIAISRFEVQEAEAQRLKTQLELAERNLADAQAALQQERERSATSTLTFEKHTEMLRRLETLNALTDSNRLLREDRSNHLSRLEELTAKVQALETELEPLKNTNRELTSRVDELSNENQALRKQVVTWKSRTTALQERAGQANVNDMKRLQAEKDELQRKVELLQKQFDQSKEASAKITSQLSETKNTHTQLLAAQQKSQEELKKAKDELQKAQADLAAAEAKRTSEAAKTVEQGNALRRIARKYKTMYEELKVEHDKLVQEREGAVASTEQAAAPASAAVKDEAGGTPEMAATIASQASRIQELEDCIAQITSELDGIKTEYETLKAQEEKARTVLKSLRSKLSTYNVLAKEKESLAAELNELKAKVASLEQGNEEVNVRSAALRSQLEGRLARLERENKELLQAKQAIEAELDAVKQRLTVAQRQLEAYQKQQALGQQQQPQSLQLAGSKASVSTESGVPENPPTANIKPMATGTAVAAQRPSVGPTTAQVAAIPSHRTTPTASIKPMAASRTAAVQPTVSISPMTVTTPSAAVQPAVREEETVPETSAEMEPTPGPSGVGTGETRQQKRTRPAETEESPVSDANAKRTRLTVAEEGEVLDLLANPEEMGEEDSRGVDTEMASEYEETPADEQGDEGEEDVEDEAEDLENEEEESGEVVEGDEEYQTTEVAVDEGDDQRHRDEREEPAQPDQFSEVVVPTAEEPSSAEIQPEEEESVDQSAVQESRVPAAPPAIVAVPTAPAPAPAVSSPATLPPPREDRLPPFPRPTITYDDGGDDGIVPSTPVLLPPRANDGFAEAVSSPQVNTRFVFGMVPEMPSFGIVASTATGPAPSHLESQGMEDTRMDLSQLEENTSRSVPPASFPAALGNENPADSTEENSVVPLVPAEEQADLEGGPDLEGDAAAELDLLRDDDQEARESSEPPAAPQLADQDVPQSTQVMDTRASETSAPSAEVIPQQIPAPAQQVTLSPGSTAVRGSARRGTVAGYPRARGGLNREGPRMGSPSPSRPVPITWTPTPAQPNLRENPRVFRRATAAASPAGGAPVQGSVGLLPDPVMAPGAPVGASPNRGRGAPGRGRPRSRTGRRP